MEKKQMIYESMNKIMSEIEAVGKEKSDKLSYKFRSIDAAMNAMHPILSRNKVFILTNVLERKEQFVDVVRRSGDKAVDKHVCLKVEYKFVAEDGSFVTTFFEAEGVDTGDKATGKALSFAYKYNLLQTFCIPTEDIEDGDKTPSNENSSVKKVVKNEDEVVIISKGSAEQSKKAGFVWSENKKVWYKKLTHDQFLDLNLDFEFYKV